MALRMMEGDDRRLTKSQVVPKFSVETELAAEEIRTGFLEFTISNIGQRSNQNVLTVFDIVGLVSISSLRVYLRPRMLPLEGYSEWGNWGK